MNTDVLFSSKSEEWETPDALFRILDERYGPFDLDAAATAANAKCARYLTKEDDALSVPWSSRRVWLNPPYGRGVGAWIAKADAEVLAGRAGRVVVLLPARTDTAWFHDVIYRNPRARVIFLRGRLHFNESKTPAPFPSMVVIFELELS